MFKRLILAGLLACAASSSTLAPAFAENFTVPEKNPVVSLAIPDQWKSEEIDWGYSATSPDKTVAFYVESATAARLANMFATNEEWLNENKIKEKGEHSERDITIGDLKGKILSYPATDEEGDTIIDFVVIDAGKDRKIMLTLWGSEQSRAANKADLDAIQNSIKALN